MDDSNEVRSTMPVIIKNVKPTQRDAFLKALDELLR